ncbi:bacteriophage Gp15 family protein [Clostridium perfringens]|uniref:Bacteriophage Gp15 family protein n=1 Tax=Clostridium perfringens TaxID=1502 RepID=A0ABD4PXH8_CLOPF|nr:bacteriophage Gp15 family protein [Clostridium perfringens]MBO3417915.1 bacteriophage Gp15 family protein [Clostridium perfringens]
MYKNNILLDKLPTKVKIGGKFYNINSDFRISILFELLMQDEDIEDELKITQALKLYFSKIPPLKYIEETINAIMWFYGCGDEKEELNKRIKTTSNDLEQAYCFEHDNAYIFDAFISQYKIDLSTIEYLHWWKFRALFEGLTEENMIVKIMNCRTMDLNKIEDKNERAFYKEKKEFFKLPNKISKEDEEYKNNIEEMLMNGGVLNMENL